MAQQIINIGISPNDGTGDTLRDGGDKINDNFSELYTYANNKLRLIGVPVNWNSSDSIEQQISVWFNSISPLTIFPQDIPWVRVVKNLGNGAVQYSFYWLKTGKGVYGSSGEQTNPSDFYFMYKRVDSLDINTTIDLGEIGTDEIQNVVNSTGPYDLDEGTVYIFQATRSGEPYEYYYIGEQGISVGDGETQTAANEYIDLGSDPAPPDLDDYLTINDFNTSLYSKAKSLDVNGIENFDFSSQTDDFLIIEDTSIDEFFFAQKQSEEANFNNSKIYFPFNGLKTVLGVALVSDSYNYWNIGEITNNFAGGGAEYHFNYWLRISRPIHIIDGKKFTFEKGITAGEENNAPEIEVNDLALNGVYYDQESERWYKGDLKCIDNTGDLSTGILTKWQPQDGATPLT